MLRALATVGESAAIMAHEIKNPITAVNLALRAVADELGQEHKDVLDDMAWRLGRLQQLMRQTLSFVRPLVVETGRWKLKQLVEDAVTDLQPHLDRTRSRVVVDVEPGDLEVMADPARLGEVLINLIQNALETETGPRAVTITARRRSAGQIELLVEDDGPGIPDDIRETVFKPFVTKKQTGTGLGLPICRRILEEHHGTIDLVDSAAGGAAFVILLPEAPST
jgi:signal transduction histidine kinase